MKLYFSGALNKLGVQTESNKSLGGYMSTTPVPNGRIGGIFPSISLYGQKHETTQVFAFFIYNDTIAALTNITIQQILDEEFGIEINQATYEWAAVLPTADLQMELIRSSRDQPLYATFFDPTTTRESCLMTVTSAVTIGTNVTLLGETIPISGDTIEDLIDDVVDYFASNADYEITKYSETKIYIKKMALTDTQAVVELLDGVTPLSSPVSFSGFVDGATLVSASLAPAGAIGIWIKRKVLPQEKIDCELLDTVNQDNTECLEVLISHD